jgi:hypothetical protein
MIVQCEIIFLPYFQTVNIVFKNLNTDLKQYIYFKKF